MLIKKILFSAVFLLVSPFIVNAQNNSPELLSDNSKTPEINFFYSLTCTNCQKQEIFLSELIKKYPNLNINRYEVSKSESAEKLKDLTNKYGGSEYQGLVPITFIGNKFVVGFDKAETTGVIIEKMILNPNTDSTFTGSVCDENATDLESCEINLGNTTQYNIINTESKLKFFGLSAEKLSLPLLSILLGFFDGFNVCSLGALILILSLVFSFKSRKKILLFGGLFLIITGITYTLLIMFWSKIFSLINPYIYAFEIVIGIIGLIGAIYFFNQFIKFRKFGPQCETISNSFLKKMVIRLQYVFNNDKNIFIILGTIAIFAFVVTIIEFPCSAVIPVAFSAILTEASISSGTYFIYLGLFMLFYLLDELIVFLIAVWTMKIWTNSGKMTVWLVLVQAIVFLALAVFYIGKLII